MSDQSSTHSRNSDSREKIDFFLSRQSALYRNVCVMKTEFTFTRSVQLFDYYAWNGLNNGFHY